MQAIFRYIDRNKQIHGFCVGKTKTNIYLSVSGNYGYKEFQSQNERQSYYLQKIKQKTDKQLTSLLKRQHRKTLLEECQR